MDNFLNPEYPVRCITYGPSDCGKSYLLTNWTLYAINEF